MTDNEPGHVIYMTRSDMDAMETRAETATTQLRKVAMKNDPSVWWIEQKFEVITWRGGKPVSRSEVWRELHTVLKD